MDFFFVEVYFSEAWFIHHLTNASCDNMQKTPFQISPQFSYIFKMFQCMSTQENHELRILRQFSPDMVFEIWLPFLNHLMF